MTRATKKIVELPPPELEPEEGPEDMDPEDPEDDAEELEDIEEDDQEGQDDLEPEEEEDYFDLAQLSQLLVTEEGEPLADVLSGIRDALDKHNKILFKLVGVLEAKLK